MTTVTIPVSKFKARCTEILREVETGRKSVRVTRRGRVVARVGPPEENGKVDFRAFFGAGSGVRFAKDFSPEESAADAGDWEASR